MTVPNVPKVEQLRISRVPVDVSKTYNVGDWLKWDDTNKVAQPTEVGDAASAAVAALILGVALDSQPITSLNQNLPFQVMNVMTKGLMEFTVDDNATYYPGDAVTLGAGPSLVRHTAASGSAIVGYVAAENQEFSTAAGVTTGITAVALSTKLLIYIVPQFVRLSSW
jgi:hypothetical protein